MRKHLLLVVLLFAIDLAGFTQTSPQTKTATSLNNLNNFRDVIKDGNYTTATALDRVINN